MLARQERQDESYQEVPTHQAEEHKPERQEMFVHRVLNTSLRSHFQVLFIVTALLAMLVTIGSGISASRGYTLRARPLASSRRMNGSMWRSRSSRTRSASRQSRRASLACRSRRRRIFRMKVNKMEKRLQIERAASFVFAGRMDTVYNR